MSKTACGDHLHYDSQTLAENAVTLHLLSLPNCGGIDWFPCGDHFHIGHRSIAIGNRCKNDAEHLAMAERRRHG